MSIKAVHPQKLTEYLSEELKNQDEIQPPEWSHYAKTGAHRERPPDQPDWWYERSASILRRVYEEGPLGVSRLRSRYGGRKVRGSSPEKFRKGGGKIVRTILQQLENAGLVRKVEGRGRRITSKGTSTLTRLANRIKGASAEESEEE